MSITFAALANNHYRWLLCGNVAQFFAVAARMMLCNLLAWQLTGKEVSLAYINLSLAIPMFIGALIAGAIVDQFERRRLILIGLSIIIVSEASVAFALVVGKLTFLHLLVVTFVGGCAHPFIHPASIAMMYSILGREHMANGVALLSSGMNLSRILGPAVTGAVLAWFNPALAYSMVALLFSLSFICQWNLPINNPVERTVKSLGSEIKQGVRYLFEDKALGLTLLFSLPPLMLLMSVQYMLVLFANNVWGVGDAGLGILLTSMGFGAFVGAIAVARFGSSISRFKLMLVAGMLASGLFLIFSQTPKFYFGALFLMLANMSSAICLVTNQVVVQLLAKEEARGRVSGYILMSYSLAPLVMFPLSMLADRLGVDTAVFIAACVVIVLLLIIVFSSRSLRAIDDLLNQGKTH